MCIRDRHGLHLPMGTDQLQAEWFAARLADMTDALVWPTLTYGHYPAFVAYPGSLSLSRSTFETVVTEIVTALGSYGAQRILILDTGLSTGEPIASAIARSSAASRVSHLRLHRGPRYRDAVARLSRQSHGSHADELGSQRQHDRGLELVDMSRAAASPPLSGGPIPGPLCRDDPASANYSASGSFGDPTLASRETGQALIEAILQDLAAAIVAG